MLARFMVLVALALVVAGCSKLTAANYTKVKVGMSYSEVTAILGSPASCDEAAGLKSCRWGDNKSHATIRFGADKVLLHTAENLR